MGFTVRVNVMVKLIKKTTSKIEKVVLELMGCFGVILREFVNGLGILSLRKNQQDFSV